MVEDRPVHVEVFDDAGRGGRAPMASLTDLGVLAEYEGLITEALESQESRTADSARRKIGRRLRALLDRLSGRGRR
jgi:hypothetical protein